MTDNVWEWVRGIVAKLQPQAPVLEVGAQNINGSVRALFPEPYVGMDRDAGPGVDLVHDATTPIPLHVVDSKFSQYNGFPAEHYKTVVCCETLEHVDDISAAVQNMADVMAPGGLWIGTIPFIFGEHNYPSDYWRVTRSGMEYLLAKAGLTDIQTEYAAGSTHVYATARKP